MPFTGFDHYNSAISNNVSSTFFTTGTIGAITSRWNDLWNATNPANPTPTASVALTGGSNLAIPTLTGGHVENTISNFQVQSTVGSLGTVMIMDRLVHQAGLSGITGTQTVNLPTVALPRYTDGRGVMLAIRIYTQIGATSTTVTASYTNQDGVAGRTAKTNVIGNTGFREVGRLILLALQEGDTGVRSVQSITLAASTGTAGNIGVVLFKPLALIPLTFAAEPTNANFINGGLIGNIPEYDKDACLCFCVNFSLASGAISGVLTQTKMD